MKQNNISKSALSKFQNLLQNDFITPTMAEFSDREIILSTGPMAGEKFRTNSQPFILPIFNAIENPEFQEVWVSGPAQSGKTLTAFSIPAIYFSCVCAEDIMVAVPQIPMAADKWQKDFLPIIEKTKYESLIGRHKYSFQQSISIKLNNGVVIKFFSGASKSDASKAGYTGRVLIITEASSFAKRISTSEEGSIFQQLRSRTNAFGSSRKIICEGTPTTPSGIVTHTIENLSTNNRIFYKCPHCREEVHWNSETFRYTDSKNCSEFVDSSFFECPKCQGRIYDLERKRMLSEPIVKQLGQTQPVFGLRWGAFDNTFWTVNEIAANIWRMKQGNTDKVASERTLYQHIWGEPYVESEEETAIQLFSDEHVQSAMVAKQGSNVRYQIPDNYDNHISMGIDVHNKLLFYTASVSNESADIHILDYGTLPVDTEQSVELGIMKAIVNLFSFADKSYRKVNGTVLRPTIYCVDEGYQTKTVRAIVRKLAEVERRNAIACKGWGKSLNQNGFASKTSLKDRYYEAKQEDSYIHCDHEVDYAKMYLINRLANSADAPMGKFTVFSTPNPDQHKNFFKHLFSERRTTDQQGRLKWTNDFRENHYLDSTILSILGLRILKDNGVAVITFADEIVEEQSTEEKPVEKPVVQPQPVQQYPAPFRRAVTRTRVRRF